MRDVTFRGYLFIPALGPPVVIYLRNRMTVPTVNALRGDDLQRPGRAAVVRVAAKDRRPGLYKAKVGLHYSEPGARFTVTCGPRLTAVLDELGRLRAQAQRRESTHLTESEVKEARAARAMAVALRLHVLAYTPRRARVLHRVAS